MSRCPRASPGTVSGHPVNRALRLTLTVVIALDVLAWASGRLSGLHSVALLVAVECATVVVYLAVEWHRGKPPLEALPPLRWLVYELHAWVDLWRLIRGKVIIPPGSTPLHSKDGWWHFPAMISGATLIEIIAVELLLSWVWLRVFLLLGSLYSLMLLWGYLAGKVVYPHYIGSDLVLREGRKVILRVPLELITGVRIQRNFDTQRKTAGRSFVLPGPEGTNTHVLLAAEAPYDSLSLWLDNPHHLTRI